jgi:hypothetical protein
MVIRTWFAPNSDLQLDAYSHSTEEFSVLEHTLALADIQPIFSRLPRDPAGRRGQRYVAQATQVPAFESVLGGSFLPNGRFVLGAGAGNAYACRELTIGGAGSGCENMLAPSLSVAQTKCWLIAGTRNWFGGVPRPGSCP